MKTLQALFVVAALAASTVVQAATPAPVAVRVDDLNLSTAVDRAILTKRINTAANTYCRQRLQGVEGSTRFQQVCRRGVVAEIRAKL